MAERLTPEQLNRFADELEVAYPDRAVIRGLRQAARDARTLDRVRAWTLEGTTPPTFSVTVNDAGMWREGHDAGKHAVAALLRAEEE